MWRPSPEHLSLSPRMLTFSNNVEPANGFLVRYLRRKLLESDTDINANKEELLRVLDWVPKLWYHLHTFLEKHSTSDFLIGTALPCPPLPRTARSCGSPWGPTQPCHPALHNQNAQAMHTSIALPWVALVPVPGGSCHHGVRQGCPSYWHPSLGTEEPCFPRQVSVCLTVLLGDRSNIAALFLARELACQAGAARALLPEGGRAQGTLHSQAWWPWCWCCHRASDWSRGTQLPFLLSAFPLQVPASSCPAPLELRISEPGSLTCGTTPSSLTCRRGQKMGSRYTELPGTWGRKPVVLGDMLMQQSNGAGKGQVLGFWAQVASLSVPALHLQWVKALSWGVRGAMSPPLACAEEAAATRSLPAGPRAEGSLGGPRGVGAGHPALAISAAGPVQAVPPASTHHRAPQHRFPSRGTHRQRHDAQLPGLGPSGTALLCRALGGGLDGAGGAGRAGWSCALLSQSLSSVKITLTWGCRNILRSWEERWMQDGSTGRQASGIL